MSSQKDFALVAPGAEGYVSDHPLAEHETVIDAKSGLATLTRKKIAICGFASSSRHRIPNQDGSWSIWSLNQFYRHNPRADRWFDIHLNWREDNVEGTDHPRWMAGCGIPVYMTEVDPAVPTSVRFPIERLIAKHGNDYFTSTIAFMIALAIDEVDRAVEHRAQEMLLEEETSVWKAARKLRELYGEYVIAVIGVDLVVGTEYEVQKACTEFWLGEANGRGIQVAIPVESALLKQQYRYGYEKEPGIGLLQFSELDARSAEIDKRKKALWAELQTLDGAQQENRYVHEVLRLRSRGAVIPMNSGVST